MSRAEIEVWDLWYPKAAATGMPFARCRIDAQDEVLVHSAPEFITVTVTDDRGQVKAHCQDLKATQETPITRLKCRNGTIEREDIWPGEQELGSIVILPGGEAGVLKKWWHASDHSEWRWEVEFYNHR